MKTLDEVTRVKERVEGALLTIPGVHGVGVGYRTVGGEKSDELAIIVMARVGSGAQIRALVPSQIDGIPTEIVERDITLHPS